MEKTRDKSRDIPQVLLIETTIDDQTKAEELAAALVKENLVACAHISGPFTSMYTWQGTLCQDQEVHIRLKTLPGLRQRVEEELSKLHPYEVPEILYAVHECSKAYCTWVQEICTAR